MNSLHSLYRQCFFFCFAPKCVPSLRMQDAVLSLSDAEKVVGAGDVEGERPWCSSSFIA